jgi:TolB protein
MPRGLKLVAALTLAGAVVAGAQGSHGLFNAGEDIGVIQPGTTVFDPSAKTYTITGGGADLWGTMDDFRFEYQELLGGNGALQADVHFPPGPHPPNEKAVLMFRQSKYADSPYVDVAIHADGHVTLQWRAVRGGITADTESPQRNPTTLRIERKGDHYTAFTSTPDGKMSSFASIDVKLTASANDGLYVGLGVCAHDANGLATVTFSNVKLEQPPLKLQVIN